MVLELKVPHGETLSTLKPMVLVLLSCVLSFIYIGIYWNNHHLLHAMQHVNGAIMWANLHLLFWLSMLPFVNGWMSENYFASISIALLWRGFVDVGDCIRNFAAGDHRSSGQGFVAGQCGRPGFKRQVVTTYLFGCHCAGSVQDAHGGPDLAYPGSTYKAGFKQALENFCLINTCKAR